VYCTCFMRVYILHKIEANIKLDGHLEEKTQDSPVLHVQIVKETHRKREL
jgi:hypothetical protein